MDFGICVATKIDESGYVTPTISNPACARKRCKAQALSWPELQDSNTRAFILVRVCNRSDYVIGSRSGWRGLTLSAGVNCAISL